jgi:aminoglycoside phosphotransferase (APT) family kinase protein
MERHAMIFRDKDNPSAETIEDIRRAFPCEPEIDRILTRKMTRRSGPGYSSVSIDRLVDGVTALLDTTLGEPFEISDPHWLSGGASKIQLAFTLIRQPSSAKPGRERLVLRMEPAESLNETSRLREFQLLQAFKDVVPVPEAICVDIEGTYLPYPSLVCGFVQGVTKPSNTTSQITGMGTHFSPEWRSRLAGKFVENLATIHSRPIGPGDLSAFQIPAPGTQSAILGLNMWARVWEEDCDEDIPLMRFTAAWLRENAPVCDKPVILHCDYRTGNFLFTEDDARISAILDWEGGRIGDPHQDLAWTSSRSYGQWDETGKQFLVGGLIAEDEFFDRYHAASGVAVNKRTLDYYRVLTGYIQGVLSLGSAYRVARNGKTHQDVLQTLLLSVGPSMLDDLRSILEEVA